MADHVYAESRIFHLARNHLPGTSVGPMRLELFPVVREFLARTDAWYSSIQIDVSPGVNDYTLTPPPGAMFNRLLWVEGVRPDPNVKMSGPRIPGGVLVAPGMSEAGTGDTILRFLVPVNATETWRAHVSYVVTDPTDEVGMPQAPGWIYDRYERTFVEGLISRMMEQPAKPYSNEKGAILHGRRFQNGMSQARAEVQHMFVRSANVWSFPQSFRTDSQRF